MSTLPATPSPVRQKEALNKRPPGPVGQGATPGQSPAPLITGVDGKGETVSNNLSDGSALGSRSQLFEPTLQDAMASRSVECDVSSANQSAEKWADQQEDLAHQAPCQGLSSESASGLGANASESNVQAALVEAGETDAQTEACREDADDNQREGCTDSQDAQADHAWDHERGVGTRRVHDLLASLQLQRRPPNQIKIVDLSLCRLGDYGARKVVSALLVADVHVSILKLHKNMLGDAGAQALSKLVERMSSPISEMHLSHNYLSHKGVLMILLAVAKSPKCPSTPGASIWLRVEQQYVQWVTHHQEYEGFLDYAEQQMVQSRKEARLPPPVIPDWSSSIRRSLLCANVSIVKSRYQVCSPTACSHGALVHIILNGSTRPNPVPSAASICDSEADWRSWEPPPCERRGQEVPRRWIEKKREQSPEDSEFLARGEPVSDGLEGPRSTGAPQADESDLNNPLLQLLHRVAKVCDRPPTLALELLGVLRQNEVQTLEDLHRCTEDEWAAMGLPWGLYWEAAKTFKDTAVPSY